MVSPFPNQDLLGSHLYSILHDPVNIQIQTLVSVPGEQLHVNSLTPPVAHTKTLQYAFLHDSSVFPECQLHHSPLKLRIACGRWRVFTVRPSPSSIGIDHGKPTSSTALVTPGPPSPDYACFRGCARSGLC